MFHWLSNKLQTFGEKNLHSQLQLFNIESIYLHSQIKIFIAAGYLCSV